MTHYAPEVDDLVAPAYNPLCMIQTELDVLRDVSHRLASGGIAFMLTGSMAMNYYAQPRMTRDIDLVVNIASDQTDLLISMPYLYSRGEDLGVKALLMEVLRSAE